MDHYDDDDGPNLVSRGVSGQALDVYPEEDPYMTGGGGDSEDDSEKADLEIKPTDLVIMAARNEVRMCTHDVAHGLGHHGASPRTWSSWWFGMRCKGELEVKPHGLRHHGGSERGVRVGPDGVVLIRAAGLRLETAEEGSWRT
eukprot:scaffold106581_cov20-Tisochrysis_lutea.AAC.5